MFGLLWNPTNDTIRSNLESAVKLIKEKENTKRIVQQTGVRFFDSLGLLSPFLIRVNILFEKIWEQGAEWNSDLPEDMAHEWSSWCEELPELENIVTERCVETSTITEVSSCMSLKTPVPTPTERWRTCKLQTKVEMYQYTFLWPRVE